MKKDRKAGKWNRNAILSLALTAAVSAFGIYFYSQYDSGETQNMEKVNELTEKMNKMETKQQEDTKEEGNTVAFSGEEAMDTEYEDNFLTSGSYYKDYASEKLKEEDQKQEKTEKESAKEQSAVAENENEETDTTVAAGSSNVQASDVADAGTNEAADTAPAPENSNEEVQEESVQEVEPAVQDTQTAEPAAAETANGALSFQGTLLRPISGEVLMDFKQDGLVYFKTLNQYKHNPAMILQAELGTQVMAAASGVVEDVQNNPQTGMTVTMDLGSGYKSIYGQMENIACAAGDKIEAGAVIGTVAAPTKYYTKEGTNLYFEIRKEDIPVDPKTWLAQ